MNRKEVVRKLYRFERKIVDEKRILIPSVAVDKKTDEQRVAVITVL